MQHRKQWRVASRNRLGIIGGLCLCFLGAMQWACESPRPKTPHPRTVSLPKPQRYVGFSVSAPDWVSEKTFASMEERLAHLEEQGYLVAQHTSHLYGNMVRVPISLWSILGTNLIHNLTLRPVYELEDAAICEALKKAEPLLHESLKLLKSDGASGGHPVYWGLWDAFLTGIHRYNRTVAEAKNPDYHAVFVDLLLVDLPPNVILEAPHPSFVEPYGCQMTGAQLWERYVELQAEFARKIVQRYGVGYSSATSAPTVPVGVAIEMVNEPDYVWLPDEVQFEKAKNPNAYPCDKYITQLHFTQIPENDLPNKGCGVRSGYYRDQGIEIPHVETPLKDFRWGLKFDKYVSSFADLHARVSTAARTEIQQGRSRMSVISSAVTHVNTDWFMRMFRANAQTFQLVEAVGIHPYHWPEHKVHDMQFVGPLPPGDGMSVSPRSFARLYFKRFDFLQRLAEKTRSKDPAVSYGLSGKPLWITEFGLQTKKIGKFNADLRHVRGMFIYDRATPIPPDLDAIVWEDRWEAFLRQVSPTYLRQNHVQTFLIYTLRESTQGQTNDDDHSNFALYRPDWSLRMAPETLSRIAEFFHKFRDGD